MMRPQFLLKPLVLFACLNATAAFAGVRLHCTYGLGEPHRPQSGGIRLPRKVQLVDIPDQTAKRMTVQVVRQDPRAPEGFYLTTECAKDVRPEAQGSRYTLDCGSIVGSYYLNQAANGSWSMTHVHPALESEFPHKVYQDPYNVCRTES